MNYNKETKSLTFRRGSEVSQVINFKWSLLDWKKQEMLRTDSKCTPQVVSILPKGSIKGVPI